MLAVRAGSRDAQPAPLDQQQGKDIAKLVSRGAGVFAKLLEVAEERIGVKGAFSRLRQRRDGTSPKAERARRRPFPGLPRDVDPLPLIALGHHGGIADVAGNKLAPRLGAGLPDRPELVIHSAVSRPTIGRARSRGAPESGRTTR